jgi:hypothetical protein
MTITRSLLKKAYANRRINQRLQGAMEALSEAGSAGP